ncbi:MAG: CHAT domain-containing protein [Planctomycetes bacterium]|nr:CHAT domain-containing protein [Planctomycetota bacterium]
MARLARASTEGELLQALAALSEVEERFTDALALARELARAREKLARLGADPESCTWAAMWAGMRFNELREFGAARREFEFVLTLPEASRERMAEAQIELALMLTQQQELAAVDDYLASSEWITREPAVVRRWSAATQSAPGEDVAVQETIAQRWFSARAQLEIQMGRPDRAAAAVARQEKLAEASGDALELWDALDNRMRLMLTLDDEAEALRWLDRPRTLELIEVLASVDPDARLKFAARRATAEYELTRTTGADPAPAKRRLLEIRDDPGAPTALRVEAATRLALIGCDTGDAQLIRAALGFVREHPPTASSESVVGATLAAFLDALEVAAAVEPGGEPGALDAALARLTHSFTGFVGTWKRVSARRIGLAYLRSSDRYMIPSELLRGFVTRDGPDVGGREALAWIHRLHTVGGLASVLFADAPEPELERDLDELCRDGAGVLLIQPGRTLSHLVTVDASGVDVELIAAERDLLHMCAAFSNAAANAIHESNEWSSPALASALAELDQRGLGPRTRAKLDHWSGVTVIGDESVGHFPLDALRNAAGARWGDVLAINYSPSLPIAAELARRARRRGRAAAESFDSLILGAPAPPSHGAFDEPLEPLRIPQARFDAWRARLAGRVELHTGVEAALEPLLASGERELAQIVAHGTSDPQRNSPSGFVLHAESAADCAVWSTQIESGRAARVVALAVCGAANRPVSRGDDGRSGLAASFVLAGADCVIHTDTDLLAGSAVDLFERVTSLVSHGHSPARALAAARGERERAGRARVQDYLVHCWGAGLIAVAESSAAPEPASAATSSRRSLWIAIAAGGAALLMSLAALVWRRRPSRAS